jgi:hypothetical protein
MLVSCEPSIEFHQTTRRYIPEDRTLHNRRCQNVRSYKTNIIFRLKSVVILTVTMYIAAVCDVTWYSLVDVYRGK